MHSSRRGQAPNVVWTLNATSPSCLGPIPVLVSITAGLHDGFSSSETLCDHSLRPPSLPSPFHYLGFDTCNMYTPLASPEAQTILQFYDITYDEVMFYESHHQIGKYVSGLGRTVKT